MKTVAIIGFGRFGKTLYRLLKEDFVVTIFNRNELSSEEKSSLNTNTKIEKDLQKLYQNNEVIFFCVPIAAFESVIKQHKKNFNENHTLIDVLSVKMHPAKILKKHLQGLQTQAILTHPMFGPDSSKNGFENLPLIMNKFLSKENTYAFWKIFFEQKKLNVVELTPEQHDKYAANSQGVAHFIGRLLDDFKLSKTPIDSLGAKKLQEIREQTCNDTWELFTNLQNFNSFTKGMRLRIGNSYDKLYNKLLPKRVNKNYLVYGIQGGIGSFNEQALQMYVQEKQIAKYQIKYLYRTENVLKKLHEGIIDYGLFAIHNTLGGLVQETLHSIPKYKFKINFEFDMQIKHYLMKRKDVDASHVITIMAHPQVLRQCKNTLQQKFPTLLQTSGEAELIDTAKAAEALASGKLPNTTAILGPKNLADRYKFDIIAENLQDSEENFTHFLVVSRI